MKEETAFLFRMPKDMSKSITIVAKKFGVSKKQLLTKMTELYCFTDNKDLYQWIRADESIISNEIEIK